MTPPRPPQRNDPEWTVGEEHRYAVRQNAEPWRARGLPPTELCRCEYSLLCFQHMVYLNDLRAYAVSLLDAPSTPGRIEDNDLASKTLTDATEFFLKLTS